MRVQLGDRVKDRVSGLKGIATARTEWLYGCVRIVVHPESSKDGKPTEGVSIDEPQLEVLKAGAVENVPHWREPEAIRPRQAAGPRPDVIPGRADMTRNRI